MKLNIFIEPNREEEITVYAKNRTPLVDKIERLVAESDIALVGFAENGAVLLDISEIICFYTEGSKIFALTEGRKYLIKLRLYQLEERFPDFLKINQSCLIRPDKIERFDFSVGGAVMVKLVGGYSDYVSRRQLKEVKKRIGF